MAATRLLISGKANTGKTYLLKNLPADDSFVVAIDEKDFPFPIPHTNIYGFDDMESFFNGQVVQNSDGTTTVYEGVYDKLEKFQTKYGKLPSILVIDSVSRVFLTAYDNLNEKFANDNFKLYAALDREIKVLRKHLIEFQNNGINTVIISHALYDEKTGVYSMVDKGSFGKAGGFLGTVDHAVFVEVKGNKRTIHHRNPSFASRTTLSEDVLPDKMPVDEYDLAGHIELINSTQTEIADYTL